MTRREWKRFCRALTGNTVPPKRRDHIVTGVWNCRSAKFSDDKRSEDANKSAVKLAAVFKRLELEEPDVVALLEIDFESKVRYFAMAKRFRKAGYEPRMLMGEGGSGRRLDEKEATSTANGILTLFRKRTVKVKAHGRLEERTVGAVIEWTGETTLTIKVAVVHGLHHAGLSSFALQLDTVSEWMQGEAVGSSAGDGILMADFNYVACKAWRDYGGEPEELHGNDLALRRLAGNVCSCCEQLQLKGSSSHVTCRGMRSGLAWTRFGKGGGAMLDGAVAFGAEQGKWQRTSADPMQSLSDHAWVSFRRDVPPLQMVGPARPRPAWPRGDTRTRDAYRQAVRESAVRGELEDVQQAAELAGCSAAKGAVRLLRKTADEVVDALAEAERRRVDHPRQRAARWKRWAQAAYALRSQGLDPFAMNGGILFDMRTGLARVRRKVHDKSPERAWNAIIAHCNRQYQHARKKLIEKQRRKDAIDEEACSLIEDGKVSPLMALQLAYRSIREPTASLALNKFYPKDDLTKEPVSAHEGSKFIEGLGEAGRDAVSLMANTPPIQAAFAAWLNVFVPAYETLRGACGDEWLLARELTWPVFQGVLAGIPRGKAVGAGGFSIELLANADEPTQKLFYECLMSDVRRQAYPPEWREVIYVLLVKPLPSNPLLLTQRREIALMAQDMKLVMHMVRATAYRRLGARLRKEAVGWVPGYGTSDASLPFVLATQQAARLGHSIYVLLIDLATFFPRCDRWAMNMAEWRLGLPAEVTQLVESIYGTGREDPEEAVSCRFDSAVGMGAPFPNYMGALMGEVLSPDKARILLNTVLWAIILTVRGVPMHGYDLEGAARYVVSMAYADDWAGTMLLEPEMHKVWMVWASWAPISGCKLGIKLLMKTVAGGIVRERGNDGVVRARAAMDIQLRTVKGDKVPVMDGTRDAYPHLGRKTRFDGNDGPAWQALRGKLLRAVRRISRMHKPSISSILTVSNGLFMGLGGFGAQALYVTWREAEQVEAAWRKVFNRVAKRQTSTPSVTLYEGWQTGEKAKKRRHLWQITASSLYTTFSKAMADREDTNARAAARSALALALREWGCVEEPRRWQWGHLAVSLEASLNSGNVKYVPDGYMLVEALVREALHRDEEGEPLPVLETNWEWEHAEPGGPLEDRGQWATLSTPAIFEPTWNDGLGAPAEQALLQIGVRELGHVCRPGTEGPAFMSYEELARRVHGVGGQPGVRLAYERTMAWLTENEVEPVGPVRISTRAWGQTSLDRARSGRASTGTRCEASELFEAIRDGADDESVEAWEARLRNTFRPPPAAPEAACWLVGGRDSEWDAQAGRVFIDDNRPREPYGGEQRWLGGADVGPDGFLLGWEREFHCLLERFTVDDEGYLCDRGHSIREKQECDGLPAVAQMVARSRIAMDVWIEDVDVAEGDGEKKQGSHVQTSVTRAVWVQMARWAARLGVTKVYSIDGSKRKAKGDARHESDDGLIATRAVWRHDGESIGGRLVDVKEGSYEAEFGAQIDVTEDASVEPHDVVMIIYDSQSPVDAMARFRKRSARSRQDCYLDGWLDRMDRFRSRVRAVVYMWHRSHTGGVVNEVPDILCGVEELEEPRELLKQPKQHASMTFSGRNGAAARVFASNGMAQVVSTRLLARVNRTRVMDAANFIKLTAISDASAVWLSAVRSDRCQYVDAPYVGDRTKRAMAGESCPFGCGAGTEWEEVGNEVPAGSRVLDKPKLAAALRQRWTLSRSEVRELGDGEVRCGDVIRVGGSYMQAGQGDVPSGWHFQFQCRGASMMAPRKQWAQALCCAIRTIRKVLPDKKKVNHGQLSMVRDRVHAGLDGWLADDQAALGDMHRARLVHERRGPHHQIEMDAVGGMVQLTGDKSTDCSSEVRRAITAAVVRGLELQEVAEQACEQQRRRALALVGASTKRVAIIRAWRGVVNATSVWLRRRRAELRGAQRLARGQTTELERGVASSALGVYAERRLQRAMVTCREEDEQMSRSRTSQPATAGWLVMHQFTRWRVYVAEGDDVATGANHYHCGSSAVHERILRSVDRTETVRLRAKTEWDLRRVGQHALRQFWRAGGWKAMAEQTARKRKMLAQGALARQKNGMQKWGVAANYADWNIISDEEMAEKWELTFDGEEKLRTWLRDRTRITARMWSALKVKGLRCEHYVMVDGFAYSPSALAQAGTLSGAPAQPIPLQERMVVEIEPRARGQLQAKARLKRRRAVAQLRRAAVMQPVVDGAEPDDSGMWAVDELLDVRRPKKRRGMQLQVKVAWTGRSIIERRKWPCSWIDVTLLSADMRREARRKEKVKYGEPMAQAGEASARAVRRANSVARQEHERVRQQWAARLRTRASTDAPEGAS